ncbi:MAG: hypothetical protein ACPL0C_01810 [Candidatus Bathyarchaeales archaeon]
MPTIAASHLYTFAALIAVGSLLTTSFMVYANTIRETSENKKLEELMNLVAANSIRLITLTLSINASTETFLQLPARIGDKNYWIKMENDTSKAWLKGGFGSNPTEGTLQTSLAKNVLAAGFYVSGYGAARLRCFFASGVVQIQISNEGE